MTTKDLKTESRQRCMIYTRVVGYCRPVNAFNVGMKSMYKDRLFFMEEKTANENRKHANA